MPRPLPIVAAITLGLAVSGCAWVKQDLSKGFNYFGDSKPSAAAKRDLAASKVTTIGVNAYLWRAALDTISFMPLVQADANGGVIVTDWYANPASPNERMKLTISILDKDLRVAASRQVSQGAGWVDAPVQAATVQKLEEIILTKARDLRRSAIAG